MLKYFVLKKIKKTLDIWEKVWYNKYRKKKREVVKMIEYTVQHKHCGMTKVIEGNSVWDAFNKYGLDSWLWVVISSEKK